MEKICYNQRMSERKFIPDRQGGRLYIDLSTEMDYMRQQMEGNNPVVVLTVLQRYPDATRTMDYASILMPFIDVIHEASHCTKEERDHATRDGALLGLALCQGVLSKMRVPVEKVLQSMLESHIEYGETEDRSIEKTAQKLHDACQRGMGLFTPGQEKEIRGWMSEAFSNEDLTPYWMAGLGGVVYATNIALKVIDDVRVETEASGTNWDSLISFCEGEN